MVVRASVTARMEPLATKAPPTRLIKTLKQNVNGGLARHRASARTAAFWLQSHSRNNGPACAFTRDAFLREAGSILACEAARESKLRQAAVLDYRCRHAKLRLQCRTKNYPLN